MNDFQKLLKNYQKKLTNLSGSNKSLVQLRLSSSQDIDFDDLDYVHDLSSFDLIKNIIEKKQSFTICAEQNPRHAKTNEVSTRLKNIKRKDNTIFEERGVKDLYIGWPYVEGKLNNGSPIRCPLLYIPVELDLVNEQWKLKMRKDVSITFNKTFLLAYAFFNGIKLDDNFLDSTFSDFDKDIIIFRTKLYEYLKNSPLDINFNQDLFNNRLNKFVNYTKEDYSKSYETGIIKLQPYAVLGVFPQAGSYLIPDYEELLQTKKYKNLEELFISKTFTDEKAQNNFSFNYLNKIKEEHIITPLPIDASQENALKALKEGHSLVVQGPPGTGKSQLICNMVTDYIARGKRVLVVCQKRVALDVVHNRLKEIDLAPFTALVHDFKSDRASLYSQINQQIEDVIDYQSKNNEFNTIHLEREFSQTSRQIDQLLEQLEQFRAALFNDDEYGVSIKELYLTSDKQNAILDLNQQYRKITHSNEIYFEKTLARIFFYQNKFPEIHPWFERVNFSSFDLIDQQQIVKLLDEIPHTINKYNKEIKTILGHNITYEESFWLANKKDTLTTLTDLLSQPKVFIKFQLNQKHAPNKGWLSIQEQQIDELYRDTGIETSIPKSHLGGFLTKLQTGIDARKTPIGNIWWYLFNKDRYHIKRVMIKNNLPWTNKGFKKMVKRVDNRLNLEHKLTIFKETVWLTDIPKNHSKETLLSWFNDNFQAIECNELLTKIKQYKDLLGFKELTFEQIKLRITAFEEATEQFQTTYDTWLSYFTKTQINKISLNLKYSALAIESLSTDFDDLCLYDQINSSLTIELSEILTKLDDYEEQSSAQKINIFKDSNRLAWINHLEKKHPVLKIVSTEEINLIEEELKDLIDRKRIISKDLLLLKVREQTYQNLEYNRLNNRVTYRDIQHQVTKKRQVWPLRKVLSEFYDDIFNLIPCWLASPEAVSSIFPLGTIFDLVIFDEASQCFAEKSIPALERGRQVVISGDSQQLSPNDLYQARWEDQDEGLIETEKDSLLDLAVQYLPQVMLKGHYRSKYLELIDFSNRHFYKNKLQLLPHANDLDTHIPPIEYVYLEDGIWEKNANIIEAKEVIKIINKLLIDGHKSIGVITFNYKQQSLIEDLLNDFAKENKLTLPKELFIKNIENVQGDEREHIIFSLGYAKTRTGRLKMNFGSLNQEHGEKRLNVAITRAKSRITIIASILPHELNTDEAKHQGPNLLKEYLTYSLNISNGNFRYEQDTTSQIQNVLLKSIIQRKLKKELGMSEIPFADLRIHTKRHDLILTDDSSYYNAISAKEAHITTPNLLESRAWETKRIYSRNYWMNREKFYLDLKK